jgi:hypothetical protein
VGTNVLKPVGFWSYARQDDSHSDGQLTHLRAIVGKAIGLRIGEEVKLFQDTETIPFGADWAANIEEAIGQTTFFVPIVTPRFLKSENCRDEFKSFRRRMNALGRADLIFPIHYVDVERLDERDTVFGDDLAALRRQQWIDFRSLQFEDAKSANVRRWADALAASVVGAMDQNVSKTILYGGSASPPARAGSPAATRSASQTDRTHLAPASDSRVAREPDTLSAPMSGSRSASSRFLWAGLAVATSLWSVALRLLALPGKGIDSNLGEVAGRTCAATAAFATICLLSHNFDLGVFQSIINQNTYAAPIAFSYVSLLIIFAFIRSRSTFVYLGLLVLCYVILIVAMPYINSTFSRSTSPFDVDWDQFFNLNTWMNNFPPYSWIRALPLDNDTNRQFIYYVVLPTLISRHLSGLFR